VKITAKSSYAADLKNIPLDIKQLLLLEIVNIQSARLQMFQQWIYDYMSLKIRPFPSMMAFV
jgi:hypothetical protein